MAIPVRCPTCARAGVVPETFLGKTIKCKSCQSVFLVGPSTESASPREAAAPTHATSIVDVDTVPERSLQGEFWVAEPARNGKLSFRLKEEWLQSLPLNQQTKLRFVTQFPMGALIDERELDRWVQLVLSNLNQPKASESESWPRDSSGEIDHSVKRCRMLWRRDFHSVTSPRLTPDARYLIVHDKQRNELLALDAKTGEKKTGLPLGEFQHVEFSQHGLLAGVLAPPKGKGHLFVGDGEADYDAGVLVLDLSDKSIRKRVSTQSEVNRVAFSADGRLLAIASGVAQIGEGYNVCRFRIDVHDPITGKVWRSIANRAGEHLDLIGVRNDRRLIYASSEDGIVVHDLVKDVRSHCLRIPPGAEIADDRLETGRFVTLGDQGHEVCSGVISVWSIFQQAALTRIEHGATIQSMSLRRHAALALSPDGDVVAGLDNANLLFWKVKTGQLMNKYTLADFAQGGKITPSFDVINWSVDGAVIAITSTWSETVIAFQVE